jgi:prefoldin subunit 5
MPQGRELKMLTTYRIREHFESLEVERLRAEVKELQARLSRLQSELMQFRQAPNADSASATNKNSKE